MPWYHYSKKPIIELKDVEEQKIKRDGKPNGLWLSYNDEWEIMMSNLQSRYGTYLIYKVTFKKDINLCLIDSPESLEKFNKKYKDKKLSGEFFHYIDWNKVAKDYDGIKIINYHKLRYLDYNTWFLNVDINSICIWRPSKVVSKLIFEGQVTIEDKAYDSE
jgi:hypothetical protein